MVACSDLVLIAERALAPLSAAIVRGQDPGSSGGPAI